MNFASTTAFSVAENDEARGSALLEFATEAEADAFPGSQYSRTDVLRTSFLRPALDDSGDNRIDCVYWPTGGDRAATCAEVAAAASQGGSTHGKGLRRDRGARSPGGSLARILGRDFYFYQR
ncbi:hypothetical protein [Leucobacter celer]|uniref:hypothetical protein n=1 Tax=Leucobacter celer TaxID=668625 RepID=UPI0006A7B23D|nr:hypothetical protein [Leucobacter celer]